MNNPNDFVIKNSVLVKYNGRVSAVVVPEEVKEIGTKAFFGKPIETIILPNGLKRIGDLAFFGCTRLSGINLPNGLKSIGNKAFVACNSLTIVTIPDSVTSIGDNAFAGCTGLTIVTIPDGVMKIGDYAFGDCSSLKTVSIGNEIKRIGDHAFDNCKSLTSVTIPDSVTNIGNYAFNNCNSLMSVTIPESVKRIDDYAFSECTLLKYVFLKGNQVVFGFGAFANCTALKAIICTNPLSEYARYQQADDTELTELLSELRSLEKNKYKEVQFLIARGAVLLNDSVAAMRYAQKTGLLDAYAEIRGVDVDTLIESMIDDFGLDSAGRKTWMLAGRTLTTTLNSDLTLTLTDETGKLLRSVPKKGADEDVYKAVKDEYAAMKKNIKTAAKARNDTLFADFLSGRVRGAASWQKAYLRNPMLRVMGRLIVWDQDGATFTLDDHGQPIRSDGSAYTITDCGIRVAHPMEMTKEDADAWRHYYSSRALKQPFEQVWEPVADASLVKPGRYDEYTLPLYALMNQERHGIVMNGQSEITLLDCSAELRFVKGHQEWVKNEFEVRNFKFGKYTRQVNHIVALLDKATVADRIKKDDVIAAQWFDKFTLAQFTGFIADAQEAKANNVLALLLDYKEKTFPDFNPMDEFTLEW